MFAPGFFLVPQFYRISLVIFFKKNNENPL